MKLAPAPIIMTELNNAQSIKLSIAAQRETLSIPPFRPAQKPALPAKRSPHCFTEVEAAVTRWFGMPARTG